ncbi:MAG: phosphonoacetaldehyde hydrolase, partial [Planctomycetota bacterium]
MVSAGWLLFVRAFAAFAVEITIEEARGPMGMAKRDHIQAVMHLPRVRDAWAKRHGRTPSEADIDRVYEVFVPLNV